MGSQHKMYTSYSRRISRVPGGCWFKCCGLRLSSRNRVGAPTAIGALVV